MPFKTTRRLTAAGAKRMMEAAIAKAGEFGIPASVAVVDGGGHLMMFERMDGGRFHTVHSSTTKAVCAASWPRLNPGRKQRTRACSTFSKSSTSWMIGISVSN